VVEAIQGFDTMERAKSRLELYTKDLNNSYNKPIVFTEERRKHLSEVNTAEKNPFYGKKHTEETKITLKSFRSSVKWVKNDAENVEKQIDKNDILISVLSMEIPSLPYAQLSIFPVSIPSDDPTPFQHASRAVLFVYCG
jgi:hypothetical protein